MRFAATRHDTNRTGGRQIVSALPAHLKTERVPTTERAPTPVPRVTRLP